MFCEMDGKLCEVKHVHPLCVIYLSRIVQN